MAFERKKKKTFSQCCTVTKPSCVKLPIKQLENVNAASAATCFISSSSEPSENNAIITTMITTITRNRNSASSEGHRLWSDQTSPFSSQRHAKPVAEGKHGTILWLWARLVWGEGPTVHAGVGVGGWVLSRWHAYVLYVLIYSIVPSSRLYLQRRGPGEKNMTITKSTYRA